MTTPNTSIASLGLADINEELNFSANTARAFNDGIFRNLTGVQARTIANTVINISDLSGKTAFGGIMSANSVNVDSYGVITRSIVLTANTDMYAPEIIWEANVVSGTPGTFSVNGKNATYTLIGGQEQTVQANVQITATLSFQGHQIGVASKYISFLLNSQVPSLVVNGNTEANSVLFNATSVATTLVAVTDVVGGVITFSVSPNDGGVFINGNTVTLTSQSTTVGADNNRSYAVTTKVMFEGQEVASDLKTVNVRAFWTTPELTLSVPATTNNNFANTGTIRSSITLGATHAIPDANVTWTAVKVSGDDGVLTIAGDNGSANLHINVASGVFGTKKSIYDVTATLNYSNGQLITSKTQRLTLRTGAYGLAFNPSANVTASGYTAQTAVATISAAYQAGTLSWNIARVSGNVATTANSIGSGSGIATVSLPITAVGQSSAVYRVNPVLVFDGVIMANVASQVTLTAEQIAYAFSLSGPTSNTQLGAAPVGSSITTTATHDVVGGTIVFSKNNGNVAISNTATTANTSYSNNTIGSETVILSAQLRDSQSRVIETLNRTLVLRAYDPAINWIGSNNVVGIGFADQSITAVANASIRAGANSFIITAVKLNGSDLTFNTSGNTTVRSASLNANQTSVGTTEGLYQLTANATWFGVSNTVSYDVSVSATKDDAQFVLDGDGEAKNSYNFPVVANGTFDVTHVVPGGTITWARTINSGAVSADIVANNTNYAFNVSRSTVGTSSANASVTATLRDANGSFVAANTITVDVSSTVNNPSLVFGGATSNVVSNVFHASASLTLTPTVAAGLTGHTFSFSWTPVSGSANVTANTTAVVVSNEFDGVGSASGVYDVTCNVVKSGQTIATSTKRVTVTATCPEPTINFTSANDSEAGFNFPVNSYAVVNANTTPAGATVSWTWSLVSGVAANLYTENSDLRFVVNGQRSAVGSQSSVYDVTATYRTPNGTLLATRTARVTATSNRYNPALTWSFINGDSSNSVGGFATTLSTNLGLVASANASLTGFSYRITSVKFSGNHTATVATSNAAGTATVTATNNRTTQGTNQKTAVYDVYIDILYNAQVIAGPVSQRASLTITPNVIQTPTLTAQHSAGSGGVSAAAVIVRNDGTTGATNFTGTTNNAWMAPIDASQIANYQVMFHQTSGVAVTDTNGPLDTWLDLTTTRQISLSVRPPTKFPDQNVSATAAGTYQIRNKNTLAVEDTGNWSISVEAGLV